MRVFFEITKLFMQETAFATPEDLCTPSPSDLVQPRSDLLYPHSDIKLFQFLLVGAVILVLLVPLFRSLPQLSLPQLFLVPCEHIFYFEIAFFCKIFRPHSLFFVRRRARAAQGNIQYTLTVSFHDKHSGNVWERNSFLST